MSSFISVFKRPGGRRTLLIILMSLFTLFLLDRGLFWGLSTLANRFYGREEVNRNWYDETEFIRPGFFNVLIAGSSRAKEAVMPLYLHERLGLRALNTASPGRYPRYHYHDYLRFKERNSPPSIYIYGLDYFTFGKESNEKQLQALLGEGRLRKEWIAEKMNNPSSSFWSRVSLLYRAKRDLDAFFVDLIDYLSFRFPVKIRSDLNPGGISRYKGLYGTIARENRLRPSRWPMAPYDPLPGVEGQDFIRLLETLRRDRVMVILVLLPEYIAVYETNHEHQRQIDDLNRLRHRFQNLFILNYNRPDVFELDNPALFADGRWGERISHLSVFGAERLGQMLAADIPVLMAEFQKSRD